MNPNISFLYTVDPEAHEPIMLIDKHVGFDETDGYGIMGDLFQKELLALDSMGKKRIQVWINSPGGKVTDGYNIYNAILKTKTPVDTYNIGIAASIAGVIFLAGRKRIMADYSKLMYHNPYGGDDDKGLDAIRDSIATMVASRCGKTEEEVLLIMNKTTWVSAEEAMASGFCDVVEDSGELNKKRAIKTPEDAKAFWKDANLVVNKIFANKNSFDMKNIANRLKLNPEASEASVIEAIDALEQKNKTLETEVQNKTTDIENRKSNLQKKEEELAAKEEEIKNLKNEIDNLKAKAKAKEETEASAKAQEVENNAKKLIEGFVNRGVIKNEKAIIDSWTEKAKVDMDGVKNLLEGLPKNIKAEKLPITTAGADYKPASVIANTMSKKYMEAANKQ